jgi:quinol monooxygenase YgiN
MFAVLIAFAGAMVAAVGTGMLVGRYIRDPRIDLAAWSAAVAMLAISLGAQALGFALGFSGGTFRAAELGALLLGPLWLAWGLVELTSDSMPTRFGVRLATGALTIVPGAILVLDPLNTKQFGKNWPGQAPYMALPHDVLTLVQLAATLTALVVMTVTAVRTRRDPAHWEMFLAVAAIGVAVLLLVSLRISVPVDAVRPALTAAAAGLVWFAVTRAEPAQAGGAGRSGGARRRLAEPAGGSRPGRRRRGAVPQYEDDETGPLRALAARSAGGRPGAAPGRRRADGTGSRGRRARGFTDEDEEWPDPRRDRSAAGPAVEPDADVPAPALDVTKIAPEFGPSAGRDRPATTRLYGLIAIYTLLDTRADAFDRLAEDTVEAVRAHEPDTLVYVAHHVPNAPMQRIFYEVYRDRAAFDEHQRQPHIERFLRERRPCVLATNVIELNLRHAKVSALPSLSSLMQERGAG